MDWKDKRQTKPACFGDLNNGDVFVYDNIIYIKINYDTGFDICSNETMMFSQKEEIEKRNATLVLE